MTSRDAILQALDESSKKGTTPPLPAVPSGREIFSDFPEDGLPEIFLKNLAALRGEGIVGQSMDEVARSLGAVLGTIDAGPIFAQDLPLVRAIVQRVPTQAMREITRKSEWSIANDELAGSVAAITAADAFIARTGSVALRSTTAGGRRLSVLPPIHIVIGTTSQVTASLDGWIQSVETDDAWSLGTIITGPSRTSDIEKILVLGAHGPKGLIVLLLDDSRRSL